VTIGNDHWHSPRNQGKEAAAEREAMQANTARAGRARISQAKRGGSTGPPDRSRHVTCGNDEDGQPGSGRRQGRTAAAAARRLIIREAQ